MEGNSKISFAVITDLNQIASVTLVHPVDSAALSLNAFLLLANTDVTYRGEKLFISSTGQTEVIYLLIEYFLNTHYSAHNITSFACFYLSITHRSHLRPKCSQTGQPVRQQSAVPDYNKHMGSVDKSDQMVLVNSSVRCTRRVLGYSLRYSTSTRVASC